MRAKGFDRVIIGGGSKPATGFMKQRLINEIWLDIEPLAFGNGVPIFQKSDLDVKMRLIKTVRLSRNTIQLRYRVL